MDKKTEEFAKKYQFLYFEPNESEKEKYIKAEEELNPFRKLNQTKREIENKIMEKRKNSTFDKDTFAWKSGKVKWMDNKPKYTYYINGYGHSVDKEMFEKYCEYLNENDMKNSIIQKIKNKNWGDAYKIAVENAPEEFGSVNVINALFFISKGKAPIYDSFAHKAVKSLLFDIPPSEVYLYGSPGKKEVKQSIAMYIEYISLLEMVFEDLSNDEDMFIPRRLDRALWVYGHSQKRHSEINFEQNT